MEVLVQRRGLPRERRAPIGPDHQRGAQHAAPPLLLATGTDDDIVLPRNTRNLALAMEQAGGAVRVVSYDGMGHIGIIAALAEPIPGSDAVFGDVLAFLGGLGMPGAPS